MKIFIEQTDEQTPPPWEQIHWGQVERNVRRLQERIYRAAENCINDVATRRSRLEPCAWRQARTVLRGPGCSNASRLPGGRMSPRWWLMNSLNH